MSCTSVSLFGFPEIRESEYPEIQESEYPEIRTSGYPEIQISSNFTLWRLAFGRVHLIVFLGSMQETISYGSIASQAHIQCKTDLAPKYNL